MAGAMVNRATTDHLIGPDWAMNMEICDICNRDPGQSKDVVKALKKRLSHKNPKVQLLALTLLETVIKHCGDILHMHVAERDVLHEMVKLVKKKSDPHVKEKVLVLIDTWQESFGGPRARYPQYYAAYHELARAGAEFPKRPDRPAPLFNGQSQAAKSIRSPDQQDEAESSAANDFPALSVSEIQNARGIMDVLAEMLNALDPGNREGLRQDVIVELVDQCRTYKQRVVQLVNSTSDEELMSLGLALNDDLQRVLAKHDAIAAGIAIRVEKKPKSLQALVDTEDSRNQEATNKEKALVDIEDPTTQDPKQEANQSTNDQSPFEQLALPAPPVANGTTTSAPKADPGIDLLNWDDTPTTAANSLALVPVTDPLTDSTSSNHNALAIVDMFSQNNTTNSNTAPADPFGLNSSSTVPGSQPYNTLTQQPLQSQQPQQAVPYANGIAVNPRTSYNHASQFNNISSGWNSQAANPVTSATQQSLNYNEQSGDLPSPPWEAQVAPSNEVPNGQLGGIHPLPMPAGQMGGMQQMQLQGNNMGAPQTQPMYSNQPGVVGLPQMMQPGQTQMQPGFGNQTAMQPGMAVPQMQPGLGNQYGSLPPNSMPGMPYAGMQAPQMQQAVMMYPQQMFSAQYGAMTQQQQIYGSRLAGYMQHPAVAAAHYYSQGAASYGGYPGTSDLSQKMYGLSMQNSSYMGMNSPYPGANQATATPSPSPSASMGQPIKAAKPEDKFFGDLLSIAKKR